MLRATFLFLLASSLLVSANISDKRNTTSARVPVDFSMVISGGVSLGAYESGYNWAIIKALNKMHDTKDFPLNPTLRSVAGASAGSINAFLSAIYWCQRSDNDEQNRVEENLFFETWVDLGIDDLLIEGRDSDNKSTLFSRKKLKEKADKIIAHLKKPVFKEECRVPMGFAVTKVTPIIEEFQGIRIKNQSFSVPLDFVVTNGKVSIRNKKLDNTNTQFYLAIPGIENDAQKIVKVLFASSAFPGAFQQVKLDYIYKGKKGTGYFIDGGAYNNVPLDLATELAANTRYFVFMDPSNMRKESPRQTSKEAEEIPVGFLSAGFGPLGSSVEIFQQMKLYEAINRYFRGHPERRLLLSTRYFPLTAGFLEHFGAFLDRNFRLYDYHVGVYDAVYNLAAKLKKLNYFPKLTQEELMDKIAEVLEIPVNKDAYTAYRFFKAIEFGYEPPSTTHRYAAIYKAFDTSVPDNERYTTEAFKRFLANLDTRYVRFEKHAFVANARRNLDRWAARPLRKLVNRITTLENERAEIYPEYTATAIGIGMGAWLLGGMLKEKNGWDVLPINAPVDKGKEGYRNALRILPTEVAADTSNGGLSLGYEAYYYRNIGYLDGFDLKLNYVLNDDIGDYLRLDLDAFNEYDDFLKIGGGISAFGNMEGRFYEPDNAWGGNLYLDVVDIFRLTYVHRFGDVRDHNYFFIGIENLPSLLYWITR